MNLLRYVDDPVWNEVRLDVRCVPMCFGQRFVCSDQLNPCSLTDRPSCNHYAVENQSMINVAVWIAAQNDLGLHSPNDRRDSLIQYVDGLVSDECRRYFQEGVIR